MENYIIFWKYFLFHAKIKICNNKCLSFETIHSSFFFTSFSIFCVLIYMLKYGKILY